MDLDALLDDTSQINNVLLILPSQSLAAPTEIVRQSQRALAGQNGSTGLVPQLIFRKLDFQRVFLNLSNTSTNPICFKCNNNHGQHFKNHYWFKIAPQEPQY